MSAFRQLAIASMVAICVSTGCCLTKPYGIPGTCHDGACGVAGTASCGAELAVSCDDGCCTGGCTGGCARPGSLLGLCRIGKLFQISNYGVKMSSSGLGCGSGGGEVYWHDWISDPPRPDPCDTCGNWTGVVATSSGDGWADPGVFSQPSLKPACCRPAFRAPGDQLCSGLLGVSSWANRLIHGLVPTCGGCDTCVTRGTAQYGGCDSCVTRGTAQYGGCDTCATRGTAHYGGCDTCATGSYESTFTVGSGVPLNVTAQPVSPGDGRPPHPVVAKWLR